MIAHLLGYRAEVIELEATGEFKVTAWHEETYSDRDPGKLTRAGGTQNFSGNIDGSGRVEWLMCYREDGTAEYVGMQRSERSTATKASSHSPQWEALTVNDPQGT